MELKDKIRMSNRSRLYELFITIINSTEINGPVTLDSFRNNFKEIFGLKCSNAELFRLVTVAIKMNILKADTADGLYIVEKHIDDDVEMQLNQSMIRGRLEKEYKRTLSKQRGKIALLKEETPFNYGPHLKYHYQTLIADCRLDYIPGSLLESYMAFLHTKDTCHLDKITLYLKLANEFKVKRVCRYEFFENAYLYCVLNNLSDFSTFVVKSIIEYDWQRLNQLITSYKQQSIK